MTNLLEFLRARLDDDEAIAHAARPGPWQFVEDAINGPRIGDEDALMVPEDDLAPCNDSIPTGDSRHIARHDPARVLRDVAAKRATLDVLFAADLLPTQWSIFAKVIEPMAAVYSDHPDYKDWTL